eukprot:Partr_v1_DN24110_c0_g1_i2_m71286 putative MOB family member 4, phocein
MAAATATNPPLQLLRNRPGTKRANLWKWPNVPALDEMDSSFALQQHIQLTIMKQPSDIESILRLPDSQDVEVWQYEHLRIICLELTRLVCLLQVKCTPATCVEMKAGEWLYLCAAHPTPLNCTAIDYIVHTLDGATTLLNSSKYFKSRLTIQPQSLKHFQSIARRLYRIFAHAWYQHRDVFDEFERETHLYERFVRFSLEYKMVPKKLMIIPGFGVGELEGDGGKDDADDGAGGDGDR